MREGKREKCGREVAEDQCNDGTGKAGTREFPHDARHSPIHPLDSLAGAGFTSFARLPNPESQDRARTHVSTFKNCILTK